jgi:hypothetical protein
MVDHNAEKSSWSRRTETADEVRTKSQVNVVSSFWSLGPETASQWMEV